MTSSQYHSTFHFLFHCWEEQRAWGRGHGGGEWAETRAGERAGQMAASRGRWALPRCPSADVNRRLVTMTPGASPQGGAAHLPPTGRLDPFVPER